MQRGVNKNWKVRNPVFSSSGPEQVFWQIHLNRRSNRGNSRSTLCQRDLRLSNSRTFKLPSKTQKCRFPPVVPFSRSINNFSRRLWAILRRRDNLSSLKFKLVRTRCKLQFKTFVSVFVCFFRNFIAWANRQLIENDCRIPTIQKWNRPKEAGGTISRIFCRSKRNASLRDPQH